MRPLVLAILGEFDDEEEAGGAKKVPKLCNECVCSC